MTASISKLLHSWLFIDPSDHTTQTSKFNSLLNRSSTMLNNVFKIYMTFCILFCISHIIMEGIYWSGWTSDADVRTDFRGGYRIVMGEGGGGGEIMRAHAHHEARSPNPLRQGSRARLRALEALNGFDALLCYLSLIFKHSDTKCCTPPPPHPRSRHWIYLIYEKLTWSMGGDFPPIKSETFRVTRPKDEHRTDLWVSS